MATALFTPNPSVDVCIHTNTRIYINIYTYYTWLYYYCYYHYRRRILLTVPADIYRPAPPPSQWTTRRDVRRVLYVLLLSAGRKKKFGPEKIYNIMCTVYVESRHAPCNYAATWPTCTSDIWWVRACPVCLCRWQAIIINNNNKITRRVLYCTQYMYYIIINVFESHQLPTPQQKK